MSYDKRKILVSIFESFPNWKQKSLTYQIHHFWIIHHFQDVIYFFRCENICILQNDSQLLDIGIRNWCSKTRLKERELHLLEFYKSEVRKQWKKNCLFLNFLNSGYGLTCKKRMQTAAKVNNFIVSDIRAEISSTNRTIVPILSGCCLNIRFWALSRFNDRTNWSDHKMPCKLFKCRVSAPHPSFFLASFVFARPMKCIVKQFESIVFQPSSLSFVFLFLSFCFYYLFSIDSV